jgi:ferredoxin
MSRPVWFVRVLERLFPQRYLLAKATRFRPLGAVVDHLFFDGDDMMYLPKDGVIPVNQSIDSVEEVVLPSQVVERFIEEACYHWIMNFCICREAAECKDYPIDLGCLFLGEAVLGINPKLGHLATKEEALEHVRRARAAGLVHVIGRNKIDTFWLSVGPGGKLLTICNCCPCCCLWRVLPHVAPRIGAKITRMPGVTVSVTDQCQACGTCVQDICFVDAIHLDGDRAVISDECRGCGRCLDACPNDAIELRVENGDFVEEAVQRISSLVDLS